MNLTTGRNVAQPISINPTLFQGNTAEWIIERPTVNGQITTPTNYTSMYFSDCFASTGVGTSFTPASAAATQFTMLDNKGLPISTPTNPDTLGDDRFPGGRLRIGKVSVAGRKSVPYS